MTFADSHSSRFGRTDFTDGLGFFPVRALRALIGQLPPERAIQFGAHCGRIVAGMGGRGVDVARFNLALAFPEYSERERGRLLFDHYANMGRVVAELALLQGRHRETLLESVSIEGSEYLAAAEAASATGGVMVLTAHFGSWDLCAAALAAKGLSLTVVQRGFKNPKVQNMFSRLRRGEKGDLEELQMGPRAVGGALRALRQGRKLVVLADQNARIDEGIFVPYFGHLACTRYAPALIAMHRQIPVLPAFVYREGDGLRHVVSLEPPIEFEPPGVNAEKALSINVARMTRRIEEAVRRAPDHWLWLHRRWRTRPVSYAGSRDQELVYPVRRRGISRFAKGWLMNGSSSRRAQTRSEQE